jgi:hypothetical protein
MEILFSKRRNEVFSRKLGNIRIVSQPSKKLMFATSRTVPNRLQGQTNM